MKRAIISRSNELMNRPLTELRQYLNSEHGFSPSHGMEIYKDKVDVCFIQIETKEKAQ